VLIAAGLLWLLQAWLAYVFAGLLASGKVSGGERLAELVFGLAVIYGMAGLVYVWLGSWAFRRPVPALIVGLALAGLGLILTAVQAVLLGQAGLDLVMQLIIAVVLAVTLKLALERRLRFRVPPPP